MTRLSELFRGNTIKVINAKTTNDTSYPSSAQGVYVNKQAKEVIVNVKIGGTGNPSWDVTPLIWNDIAGEYFGGDTLTINSNDEYKLEIDGGSDLYFDCRNKQGTSPTITIWVTDLVQTVRN